MVLPADYLAADHASVGPRCVGDHQEAERDHPQSVEPRCGHDVAVQQRINHP